VCEACASVLTRSALHVDDGSRCAWRGDGGLLPLSQRDDERDATGPRGEQVDDWKKLNDECRQQERVESKEPPHQERRDDIERLVEGHPAKGPGDQLQCINQDSRAIRRGHAAARERRHLQEEGGHIHRVTGRIEGVELNRRTDWSWMTVT